MMIEDNDIYDEDFNQDDSPSSAWDDELDDVDEDESIDDSEDDVEDDIDVEDDDLDDDDADDAEEDEDEGEPAWVNKRVRKMAERHKAAKAEIKSLKGELERLKAATGEDDPKHFVSVAEKVGVLSRFLKPEDTKTLSKADSLKSRLRSIQGIVDRMDDNGEREYTDSKGNTWTRAELRAELRDTEDKLKPIAKAAGKLAAEARKKFNDVINAGLKALAASKGKKKKQAKRSKRHQDDPFARERNREEDGRRTSRSRSAVDDYAASLPHERRTKSRDRLLQLLRD